MKLYNTIIVHNPQTMFITCRKLLGFAHRSDLRFAQSVNKKSFDVDNDIF